MFFYPRNLPLKFGQNWVCKIYSIASVFIFVVVVIVVIVVVVIVVFVVAVVVVHVVVDPRNLPLNVCS